MAYYGEKKYNTFNEKVCTECGKTFIAAVEHQFKIGSKYFCKWTCYKHYKEKNPNIGAKRSYSKNVG